MSFFRTSRLLPGLLSSLWALLFTVPSQAAPTAVRGPYLQDLGARQAAILLESSDSVESTLEILAGAMDKTDDKVIATVKGSKDTSHELVASGLTPATSYRYRVLLAGDKIAEGSFTTAPEDDRPLSFIVYGDNRSDHAAHARVVQTIRTTPTDFMLHTGDMVHDGTQVSEWNTFFEIERALLRDRCMFPTIGNHEIAMPGSDGAARYARVFRVPAPISAAERYYTFRWASARFFMLDAQDDFDGNERDWLEKALKESDGETNVSWRFVVMHHGPYSSGLHGGNEAARMARVPQMLKEHKVDVLFAGHDHAYERGEADGLRYIVTGGGGAPLYRENRGEKTTQKFEATHHFLKIELAAGKGTLSTIRADGSLLERCTFEHAGSFLCGGVPTPAQPNPSAGTPTVATGSPAVAAPAPTSAPPAGKNCGCAVTGEGAGWLGYGLASGLLLVAGLRRRGRSDVEDDNR